ncbi:YihY/virulence factor BrkB family protein [Alteriqipengyuania sp. WL0013]|uniref:YihY/virulence factor BrkB family protein n=1 Tax=Alteriqipengyuania sp. WL0013 TaxID=3110773 RepID=UPI002C775DC2|nr:YihY/virulence factor BrkB family protein [Alteriqipengyuania sp. WL0013]MEB3416282.1 YihY/virulence factor BrkB family protein [Alteriqipengyuania sp. WL0013]
MASEAIREEEEPHAGPPVPNHTPEGRRRAALMHRLEKHRGPIERGWDIFKRVIVGTYNDGFIHAGNLAYMAMLAIFPFFILGAAIFTLVGEDGDRAAAIDTILFALPPVVANVIEPVARNVVDARNGWLLWAGGFFGLWTVGSLIETIRDILRRAYGTEATLSFWRYRLISSGVIVGAVILLMVSLLLQVMIGAISEAVASTSPWLTDVISGLALSRFVPALGLFLSIYLLFYSLTPAHYRVRRYPKWPGALVVTAWWVSVTLALPPVLANLFTYDLTYGSLAGAMIALFFFWLVGLGMVVGAQLNAALAETPEEEAEAAMAA